MTSLPTTTNDKTDATLFWRLPYYPPPWFINQPPGAHGLPRGGRRSQIEGKFS